MSEEEQLLLNQLLLKYFKSAKFGSPNYLIRNSTASILKKNLLNFGHWKNKPRSKRSTTSQQLVLNQFFKKSDDSDDCPF